MCDHTYKYAFVSIVTRVSSLTFFGDVVFSEYFCTITVFSLYVESTSHGFPLPDGIVLPRDHGLDFGHHLL